MKINKTNLKLLTLFYIVIVVQANHAAFSTASNYKLQKNLNPTLTTPTTASQTATPTPAPAIPQELPKVLFQGWVKYFRLKPVVDPAQQRVNAFFRNNAFDTQIKKDGSDEVIYK
jgi:hypothetical protein